MHSAAALGRNDAIRRLLLESRVDLNAAEIIVRSASIRPLPEQLYVPIFLQGGFTPICWAAAEGNVAAARLLLADPRIVCAVTPVR